MNVANKMVQKERFKHEGLYEIYINIDGSSKYKLIETSYFDSKLDAEVYADSLASSMYAENPKKTREQIELETEHPGYDEEYADICNDKFWEYAHKFIKSKVKKVKKEKGE